MNKLVAAAVLTGAIFSAAPGHAANIADMPKPDNVRQLPSVGPWNFYSTFKQGRHQYCILQLPGSSGPLTVAATADRDFWFAEVPLPPGMRPGSRAKMEDWWDNEAPYPNSAYDMELDRNDGTALMEVGDGWLMDFFATDNDRFGLSVPDRVYHARLGGKQMSWNVTQIRRANAAFDTCLSSGGTTSLSYSPEFGQ